jgi:phosphoenolpyruvate carboxykinase (ATP)
MTMSTESLELSLKRAHVNLPIAALVERASRTARGRSRANGALVCMTGDRTGRSPNDKYLEDTPASTTRSGGARSTSRITPEHFDARWRSRSST